MAILPVLSENKQNRTSFVNYDNSRTFNVAWIRFGRRRKPVLRRKIQTMITFRKTGPWRIIKFYRVEFGPRGDMVYHGRFAVAEVQVWLEVRLTLVRFQVNDSQTAVMTLPWLHLLWSLMPTPESLPSLSLQGTVHWQRI